MNTLERWCITDSVHQNVTGIGASRPLEYLQSGDRSALKHNETCTSVKPRAQPPMPQHSQPTRASSIADAVRWRISQIFPWKPLPLMKISARQEYSFITA